MKAAYYENLGPAREVMKIGPISDPVPAPGEVRVRLHASGVNPSDVKARLGRFRRGPHFPLVVPHSDGAGEIDMIGEGVAPDRLGQRVWLHNGQWKRPHGTAAEYIALANELVTPLPSKLSYQEGACLGIPLLTAFHAVTLDGSLRGKTILVAGGAGSVGHYAIQLAKIEQARVLTTVSSSDKARHAESAGADHVIDYTKGNVSEQIKDLTSGEGVDRIIEVNISANSTLPMDVLKPFGTVVTYGSDEDSALLPVRHAIVNSITYRFFIIYEVPIAVRSKAIATLRPLLEYGILRHAVAKRFALEQIVEAHEAIEGGKVMGNVVVDIV